jgi:hypothetical protein
MPQPGFCVELRRSQGNQECNMREASLWSAFSRWLLPARFPTEPGAQTWRPDDVWPVSYLRTRMVSPADFGFYRIG